MVWRRWKKPEFDFTAAANPNDLIRVLSTAKAKNYQEENHDRQKS